MAPTGFKYLFLSAITLLLIGAAQSPPAEARKSVGVNPFCRTASYSRVCNEMVNGATNWHDATANAMKATMHLARRVRDMVPLLKPAISHLDVAARDEIMQTCIKDFDGTISDIEIGLQSLDANDIGTARSHLSAALRRDCKEVVKEFGADFPLSKYVGHLTRKVDNCLAVLMQN